MTSSRPIMYSKIVQTMVLGQDWQVLTKPDTEFRSAPTAAADRTRTLVVPRSTSCTPHPCPCAPGFESFKVRNMWRKLLGVHCRSDHFAMLVSMASQ